MSADDPFGFSSPTEQGASARRDPSGTGFDGPVTSAELPVARTPAGLLYIAIAVGVIAIAIAVVFGTQPAMAIIAWALAGPVGIGLYAFFRLRDTSARARPFYAATTAGVVASWAALIVLVAGVLLAALRIAQWIGHL
ncbi:hypothetical protein DEJ21_13830 [Curtobacterium sp. MCSS17_006]|uniref:hypothetical protein n=1 Tax=unclassified Curtobacterium TaxID=257496 RepID=UPI000DA8FEEE|nr:MULTISPECIES: hypothetical protein [unclassified Curtobacterium]PZE34190.1 hypothetical protein DEJ21_13830 [Curtobacterium sp. MCSS17_006]ROP64140.1 hypothetical protein EDF19_3085 [Curtobacterium sp. PhB115]